MPLLPPRVLWTQFWNVLLSPLCWAEVCGISWINYETYDSLCDSVNLLLFIGRKNRTQRAPQYKITEQCKSVATFHLAWCFAGYPQICICSTETAQSFASLCIPFFCFILSAIFDIEAVVSYTTFAHCNDLKTVSKQKPHISFFGSFSLPWAFPPKLCLIPFFPTASPISWITIRGGAFSAVTRVKTGLTGMIQCYEHFSLYDEVAEGLIALACVRRYFLKSYSLDCQENPYFILFWLPAASIILLPSQNTSLHCCTPHSSE